MVLGSPKNRVLSARTLERRCRTCGGMYVPPPSRSPNPTHHKKGPPAIGDHHLFGQVPQAHPCAKAPRPPHRVTQPAPAWHHRPGGGRTFPFLGASPRRRAKGNPENHAYSEGPPSRPPYEANSALAAGADLWHPSGMGWEGSVRLSGAKKKNRKPTSAQRTPVCPARIPRKAEPRRQSHGATPAARR